MKQNNRAALIGLDGSGKSTNLEQMKQDEDFSGFVFAWMRWKPVLLAPFYRILNKKIAAGSSKTENTVFPENEKEEREALHGEFRKKKQLKKIIFRSRLVRSAWTLLAGIDYFIAFYARVGAALVRKKNIVFDRYYFDLYIDLGVNFGYSPEQILRSIRRRRFWYPSLRRVIYIRVRPEICYARKTDISSMEYLNKRYAVYELLSKEQNWLTVDGEQPLETVYAAVRTAALNL